MYQVIESKSARKDAGHSARGAIQAIAPERGAGRDRQVVWKDTIILTQDGRFLMAVAIGPDGRVWSYRESLVNDANPRMRCTNLYADTIAVGFDKDGGVVVFAALGMELDYAVCTDTSRMSWSAPRAANLPKVADAVEIAQIYTHRSEDDSLHVGVMFKIMSGSGAGTYNAQYSNWAHDGAEFRHTPIYLTGLHEMQVEELFASAASSQV